MVVNACPEKEHILSKNTDSENSQIDTSDEFVSQASRKRRRAFHRLHTGFAIHYGERLRFLTLTFVKGSRNDIHQCFRAIKERIRRLTPNKLRKLDTEDFFTDKNMKRYFGDKKNWNKPIQFDYFSVIVKEERPHMHILYFGDWIPHSWLKKVWFEITGDSDVIDIKAVTCGVYDEKRLAGYVLRQYVLNQEGTIRFQSSQSWTWRGMVRDWNDAKRGSRTIIDGKDVISYKNLFAYWVDFIKRKKSGQKMYLRTKQDTLSQNFDCSGS